ncbi:MAG: exosome complex RNA-binding protein Rrp4 [Thaumarchaeota archaeon]|nr:exosome complex RNA-binding protein Rrp4 [Nitrososphaerota archaeon]
MITRKQVIPGDVITKGDLRYGSFIEKRDDQFIALRVGLAEISGEGVKLIPLSGPYIPHVEDQVVGKVIDMSGFGWEIDINSCFFGYLPASFVFGREFSPGTHDLSSRFKIGDLLLAKVEAFDRSRDPQMSVRGPGLGKIPKGEIIKISPTKVPRLIGRKGYMIQMLTGQTNTEMIVGQNGLIVVAGPPEGILKAAAAIKMIEEEAHVADLAKKVEEFLKEGAVSGS